MLKLFKKKPKGDAAAETGTEVAPAPEGGEGEAAPAKKKPPMLIIIAAAAVFVLGGGGTGAFFLLKPKAEAAEGGHGEKSAGDHGKKKKKKGGEGGHGAGAGGEAAAGAGTVREGPDGVTFYTLPDLLVNIQSTDGRPTYLKLKLTFEMADAELAEQLTAETPRLQDMFTSFLRELRPEDLAGSSGTYQLRQEIQRRVNLIVAPRKIDAVLIEEMLVQ